MKDDTCNAKVSVSRKLVDQTEVALAALSNLELRERLEKSRCSLAMVQVLLQSVDSNMLDLDTRTGMNQCLDDARHSIIDATVALRAANEDLEITHIDYASQGLAG